MLPAPPLSLASQLPQWSEANSKPEHNPITCGSWLASDQASSPNINAACSTAIAGKPAPTRIEGNSKPEYNPKTCGSWLASD
ncbi:MAG: hypothetical protein C0439_04875 [Pseudomonas sp.]|nr:hypothetical protein [Pseudomonas sp.]